MNLKLLLCKWGLHKWTRPNPTWEHKLDNYTDMRIHTRYCQKCEKVQNRLVHYSKLHPPVYEIWLDIQRYKADR